MQSRLERYTRRKSLSSDHMVKGPLKIPSNEAETALVLQAMISSNHPAIDFRIGDYDVPRTGFHY